MSSISLYHCHSCFDAFLLPCMLLCLLLPQFFLVANLLTLSTNLNFHWRLDCDHAAFILNLLSSLRVYVGKAQSLELGAVYSR